ncbi:MAG: MmgE/PrpD family protein [Chloroflexi bacterium]|nr:MmgE/PrpD family protein [Chloroflexota bacterium]
MPKSLAERLAELTIQLRYEDLPESVRRRAVDAVLDTLGCMLAGSRNESSQSMYRYVRAVEAAPRSTVVGTDVRTAPALAALANGTSSHSMELDDTAEKAVLHPGVVVIPAAMAIAEIQGVSGADFLAAVVAGYEAVVRIGAATLGSQHPRGFHATGTTGPFGSAAAAGYLLRLNAEQQTNAFGLAGVNASGLLEYKAGGDWSKRLQAGLASEAGVVAAGLAREGYTGPRTIVEGRFGFFNGYANESEPSLVTEALGERWEIETVAIKPYACCRFNHAPLDAILQIVRQHGVRADEVQKMEVLVSDQTIRSVVWPQESRYRPQTVVDAQFSLPFCVARAVEAGRLSPAELTSESLTDERTLALAARVEAKPDAVFTALYPDHNGCKITVHTPRGTFTAEVHNAKGEPEHPLTEAELAAKFEGLAAIAEIPAEPIIRAVRALPTAPNLNDLFAALATREPATAGR